MGNEKTKKIKISTPEDSAKETKNAKASTKSSALVKARPRTIVKATKTRKKKPLPKVEIKTAEVVESKTTKNSKKPASDTASKKATAASPSVKTGPSNSKKTNTKRNMKLPHVRRLHFKVRHIIATIAILLIAGFVARVAIWEHNYLLAMEGSERHLATSAKEEEVYDGGGEVDSKEPTQQEVQEYHVAANKPRYLTIPLLNIRNARIVEVGLTSSGELDTPYNIYNIGWYNKSALPGVNGVTVMDAHGGDMGNGIFRYLPRIGVGDEITIEMGDEKTKYVYTVREKVVKNLGADANAYMDTAFQPVRAGKGSLTLITCTGDWLQTQQTYSQRLFVRAELTKTIK